MRPRPLAVAAAALAMNAAPAGAQTEPVGVSPAPGTPTASPRTEISFRNVDPGALGPIAVRGPRTGPRTGRVVAPPDGRGATLRFDPPLAAGREAGGGATAPAA